MERIIFDSIPGLKRDTIGLTSCPETARSNVVLGSDIEGPFFIGDTIDHAMVTKCTPANAPEASPAHGHIIYAGMWDYFTGITKPHRRTEHDCRPRYSFSLSQEGTDTIFTLPLLLAAGVDDQYIQDLTLKSKPMPGSHELLKTLQAQGVCVFGITTAPQEPYRTLFENFHLLDPKQIIGSPFPIDDTKRLLEETGLFDKEVGLVRTFLSDCYQIIDEHSEICATNGQAVRNLSDEGSHLLGCRIQRFLDDELGVTYDPKKRKERGPATTLFGQVIESCGMVGGRAKVAVAVSAFHNNGRKNGTLVTMGDGVNDAEMLKRANISIGLNGSDAARAAKIAVVTPNGINLLPIFEQILAGQNDIDTIIRKSQEQVGSAAIICRGGPDIPQDILAEHKKMKTSLKGITVY